METANAPAAGWYSNPDGTGTVRWWDGIGWTDKVQSSPKAPPPGPAAALPPTHADSALTPPLTSVSGPAALNASGSSGGLATKFFAGGLVAALVVAVGSFSPWANLSAYGVTATISGTEGGRDGWITLVASLIAAALLAWGYAGRSRGPVIASVVIAAISLVVGILDSIDISATVSSRLSSVGASASVGWGLVVVDLASVGLIVTSALLLSKVRGRPTALAQDSL